MSEKEAVWHTIRGPVHARCCDQWHALAGVGIRCRPRPRSLYPSDFPSVKRYAVASCGSADGTTTVVVAVFMSGWATYRSNWGTLLGKYPRAGVVGYFESPLSFSSGIVASTLV
jgi:hypothetical protein